MPLPGDLDNPTRFPPPPPALGSGAPPGTVYDGVEPVRDGQYRAVLKLGADGSPDEVVSLQVHDSLASSKTRMRLGRLGGSVG